MTIKILQLEVDFSDTHVSGSCKLWDYLEIRDGDEDGPLLAMVCGFYDADLHQDIHSTQNQVWMR